MNKSVIAAAGLALIAAVVVLPVIAAAQGSPFLVKDINAVQSGSPSALTSFDGKVFFTVSDVHAGPGLWRSDRTQNGTVRIKAGSVANLTPGGGGLFFVTTSDNGTELWKTDGSAEGLVRLLTTEPGVPIAQLTDVDGRLFFTVTRFAEQDELWTTDGTVAGTVELREFHALVGLINVNGRLFFANFHIGIELWESDGTATGTLLVTSLNVVEELESLHMADVDGTLFLTVPPGLWLSDGTAFGTRPVEGFNGVATQLTNVNGRLFFAAVAEDGLHLELWRSDGTRSGTRRLKAIWPGTDTSNLSQLVSLNGTLLFVADDGTGVGGLWRSDGTEAGTQLVRHVAVPPRSTNAAVGPALYFSAIDTDIGSELWRSDGSETGTAPVKDIRPGPRSSQPSDLIDVDGTLFFVADDGSTGPEIWKSDGTEVGTVPVTDLLHDTFSANPIDLTNVNGTLFFFADDGNSGLELWRSDGTAAGTRLVKDINPTGDGVVSYSPPLALKGASGTILFTADDGVHGPELWCSDGTETGTLLVKDIDPRPVGSLPVDLADLDGTVFFTADDGVHGRELWRSDGTEPGTVLVNDIELGPGGSNPMFPIGVNGTLFFWANDGVHGAELWKSDGSAAGTALVRDINPAPGQSSFLCSYFGCASPKPTQVDSTLFFNAWDESTGYLLWKSDGTEAGTVPVGNFFAPQFLTNVNGILFVFTSGELSRSDGTTTGTVQLRDHLAIASGPTAFERDLAFVGRSEASEVWTLWRSDGTAAGTRPVVPIADITHRFSTALSNIDGALFFTVDGEIWRSDGSAAGTVPLHDFGTSAVAPASFTLSGEHIFFTAATAGSGTELWALPRAPCSGDCDADRVVTIDELVLGVDIALGGTPVGQCPAFDVNGNGRVAIAELIAAISHALTGCG